MTERMTGLGWWAITGEDILEMMRRCSAGEEADVVYAEYYANSTREFYEADDE